MAEEYSGSQGRVRTGSAWRAPLALVLLFAVAVIFMSLFFRVARIEVVNASEYTDEQVVEASGIEMGANLFFIDRFSVASLIFSGLPYVETVHIQRELPNTVVIQIVGTAASAYVTVGNDIWLMDRQGKLLEAVDESQTEGLPYIQGLSPASPVEGEVMVVDGEDSARLEYAMALLDAFTAEGILDKVSWVNLEDVQDPSMEYEGRLTVYLGPNEEVPRKIAQFENVLSQLSEGDTGILRFTGGTSWTYSPD